jgi:hypothetical protein
MAVPRRPGPGNAQPLDVNGLIHDLTFALEVADKASAAVREAAQRELDASKEEATV